MKYILILNMVILLSSTAFAQFKVIPTSMDLPSDFNIIGFGPSERDPKGSTTFEVEACGHTFKFTFKNKLIFENKGNDKLAKLLDKKIADLCGWE